MKNRVFLKYFVCSSPFGPNLGPKFFNGFYFYYMLEIVESYYCMQFQWKLKNQTWEYSKKPVFGPNFGPFAPNSGSHFFFFFFSKIWLNQSQDITVSYHHIHNQKKLMSQSWEKPTDGQTDRWMDRWTNRKKWFHRTLSN